MFGTTTESIQPISQPVLMKLGSILFRNTSRDDLISDYVRLT